MILNYMEISLLIEHLPVLEQCVVDMEGSIILDNNGQPLMRRVDYNEIDWKPIYELVYDLSEFLKGANELVIKSYIKTLIHKLENISNKDLEKLYIDYFNGNLVSTEPYIIF